MLLRISEFYQIILINSLSGNDISRLCKFSMSNSILTTETTIMYLKYLIIIFNVIW